jgi:regulation of enolase protein 1 (concanavalin A-like superfamily)
MQRSRHIQLAALVGTLAVAGWVSPPAHAQVPGWQDKSFNEGTAGNAKVDATGAIVIQGSGNDTWEKNDGFHIVYKPLKGDGSVTTKLLAAEEGSEWSKTGVMMRNGLDDVAAAAIENHMTTQHGTENLIRGVAGTPMSKDNKFTVDGGADTSPREFPKWLKIERRGNRFQSLVSKDGNLWFPVTRAEQMQMKDDIVAGVFVCSHDDSSLLSGTFDTKSTDVSNTLLKPEQVSPLQPDPVNVTAGNNSVMLTWDPVDHLGHKADGYTIYKAPVTTGNYADLTFAKIADLPADKTSFLDDKIKNGEAAVYEVRTIVSIGGNKLESQTINGRMLYVEGAAAPPIQIGNTAFYPVLLDGKGEAQVTSTPGSVAFDSGKGVLTLTASGEDFWERGDGGTALLTKLSSDFTLSARVVAPPTGANGADVDSNGKFGLMVRDSTQGEARTVVYSLGNAHHETLRRAYTSGRMESLNNPDVPNLPIYLQIQRKGDTINFFTSTDGKTFKPEDGLPSTTIPGLSKDVYAGLAATAHDNTTTATIQFDQIKLDVTPP